MARPKKFSLCGGEPPLTKQAAILAAAQEIFLEAGYAAASMDAVAARANVSKATIYAHFSSKRALFEAVISARCEVAFADVQIAPEGLDACQILTQLAVHFMKLIMSPEAIALHRVIVGESARLPEVGEAFYGVGPVAARQRVMAVFHDLNQRGLLAMPEDHMPVVTNLFLGMMKGDIHLRAIVGMPPASDATLEQLAEHAANLIIARYERKGA